MTASRQRLVIDAAPEVVRLVTKIFEARGLTVRAAADGQAGLDAAIAQPPDLVLLDLDLPRLDGWEVCKRLKADERTRHIPIVMMTAAHATPDAARRGVDGGADEYLAKPFLREVLVHNVERLLERAR